MPAPPTWTPKVYPRVCGGTESAAVAELLWHGLSPRVRGNHIDAGDPVPFDRSIPACAGEPRPEKAGRGSAGVYPRVCGGTFWP